MTVSLGVPSETSALGSELVTAVGSPAAQSHACKQAPKPDESSMLYHELYHCCYLKQNRPERQESRKSEAQEGQPQLNTLLGSLQEHQHLLPSQPELGLVSHTAPRGRKLALEGEDTPQHPVHLPSSQHWELPANLTAKGL